MRGNNWLDEDPEWQELKQRIEGRATNPPEPARTSRALNSNRPSRAAPTTSQLPSKKLLHRTVSSSKKRLQLLMAELNAHKKIATSVFVGLAVISSAVIVVPKAINSDQTSSGGSDSQSVASVNTGPEVVDEPDFAILLPAGKTRDDLLKSEARITPSNEVIFSHAELLNGVQIEVTQQKMPESFKTDLAAKLGELAEGFQLNDSISVDEISVYYGVSADQGVQSLMTAKHDVLIFIRSPQKLQNDTWVSYITSLQY